MSKHLLIFPTICKVKVKCLRGKNSLIKYSSFFKKTLVYFCKNKYLTKSKKIFLALNQNMNIFKSSTVVATVIILVNLLNELNARIVNTNQNEHFAEIYSSVVLTCKIDTPAGAQVNWRKLNGVIEFTNH
jgi:hypothetical protein